MQNNSTRRRVLLGGAAGALVGGLCAPRSGQALADARLSHQNSATIQKYYAAWEQKDWLPFDLLLADDFTFTSPNNDDHIGKSAFKERCWKSQVDFIRRFDLEHLSLSGNTAFVLYVCHTSNDKLFRNVEYLQLQQGQVKAIECYFGAQASFASSVSTGHS